MREEETREELKERAIDIVRRKLEEKKKTLTKKEQIEGINKIIDVVNSTDYVFMEISPDAASIVFQAAEIPLEEAKKLYKELWSDEYKLAYLAAKREEREQKQRENRARRIQELKDIFTDKKNWIWFAFLILLFIIAVAAIYYSKTQVVQPNTTTGLFEWLFGVG